MYRQPRGYHLVVHSVQVEMQLTTPRHQETHRLAWSEVEERGNVGEVLALLVMVEALCTVVPLVLSCPTTRKVVGNSLIPWSSAPQTKCLCVAQAHLILCKYSTHSSCEGLHVHVHADMLCKLLAIRMFPSEQTGLRSTV